MSIIFNKRKNKQNPKVDFKQYPNDNKNNSLGFIGYVSKEEELATRIPLRRPEENSGTAISTSNVTCYSLYDIVKIIRERKYDPEKLLHEDYMGSCPELYKYLEDLDMLSYMEVAFGLMKIDQLEHNFSYSSVLTELTKISEAAFYEIDLDRYLRLFYQSLGKSNLNIAKTYLRIIKSADKFDSQISENLTAVVEDIEKSKRPIVTESSSLTSEEEKIKTFEMTPNSKKLQ